VSDKNVVHVVCIKWGAYYSAGYVNRLYCAVKRNFEKYEPVFYCFTDFSEGLDEAIIVKPLPELKDAKHAYLKEAGLCDANLGGLQGERVLYFDLDSVITGNLDCFIDFMKDDAPYITRDYGRNSDQVGGSNIYSWVVGTLAFIKDDYEQNTQRVVDSFGTASQEYLSAQIINKYGALNFYPNEWHISFKKHCLRRWPMNLFKEARRPGSETRLVNFHGDPKVHDALAGSWTTRGTVPLYKRVYKYTRPVEWIAEYWK
jgi:hypothetical protein